MKVLKIKDNYDLDNLINDYGFRKNNDMFNIYIYDLDIKAHSSILVNITSNENKLLWFYYGEDDIEGACADFAIEIPEVLFKMIQDGIIEVIEKE